MSVEDYDILNILGKNINATTYKVKHKESNNVFIWYMVDCEDKNAKDIRHITEKVQGRKDLSHPNVLKFFNPIEQKKPNVLYIMMEYCANGSLKTIIETCVNNNTRLTEELVCKIVYQIALTIKTIDRYVGMFNPKEILIDDNFNVKLLNFALDYSNKSFNATKMCNLGCALYEMCTLKPFDNKKFENEIMQINGRFSRSLISLMLCMIRDCNDLKKNINKVLCHPTVLLKSTQWVKEKSFMKHENLQKITLTHDNVDLDEYGYLELRQEKLRTKEIALQVREKQLDERERKLAIRERKLALMERSVKEKLQQAELYLNRCRETKFNKGSKSYIPSQYEKKSSNTNLDSTYVSCGDSILLPTSSKLNVNKIVKPASFTRTLSERRIRFKGHSPLKEIDLNKRKTVRQPKLPMNDKITKSSDWLTCSDDTDKSSITGSSKIIHNKSKQLFSARSNYENDGETTDFQCTPISWTEENKKYAFELLRVMNCDKENHCAEVRHTYL